MKALTYSQHEVMYILNNRFPDYMAGPDWAYRHAKGQQSKVSRNGLSYDYSYPPELRQGEHYIAVAGKGLLYTHAGLLRLIALRESEVMKLQERANRISN